MPGRIRAGPRRVIRGIPDVGHRGSWQNPLSMTTRRALWLCSCIGALQAVAIVVLVLCDRRLVATGRGDVITTVYDPETWLLLAAVISASGVGLVVAAVSVKSSSRSSRTRRYGQTYLCPL